jgi:hypothetical protein
MKTADVPGADDVGYVRTAFSATVAGMHVPLLLAIGLVGVLVWALR